MVPAPTLIGPVYHYPLIICLSKNLLTCNLSLSLRIYISLQLGGLGLPNLEREREREIYQNMVLNLLSNIILTLLAWQKAMALKT